ncbi:MAG: InlB B-repeat-containing protein [Oscillospiraceae bacterium]|jgi:hypothetical protein|nr:InlB B-repeat-containing protein [Oscillospiraceae bacterium]
MPPRQLECIHNNSLTEPYEQSTPPSAPHDISANTPSIGIYDEQDLFEKLTGDELSRSAPRYYTLEADIVVSGSWHPIARSGAPITFNGNGHTISVLTQPLFGALPEDSTIQDLRVIVDINDETDGINIGALSNADGFSGTITGVTSEGSINAPNAACVGGIIGRTARASFNGSTNAAAVTGSGFVGGIAGSINKYDNVQNCLNIGVITGYSGYDRWNTGCGGIVGRIGGSNWVEYNTNGANVTGTANVGGIIGIVGGVSDNSDAFLSNGRYNKVATRVTKIEGSVGPVGGIIGDIGRAGCSKCTNNNTCGAASIVGPSSNNEVSRIASGYDSFANVAYRHGDLDNNCALATMKLTGVFATGQGGYTVVNNIQLDSSWSGFKADYVLTDSIHGLSGTASNCNGQTMAGNFVITMQPRNGSSPTYKIVQNSRITLADPSPIPEGAVFDGWFRNLTDTTPVTNSTTYSSDTTLYAKYSCSGGAGYTYDEALHKCWRSVGVTLHPRNGEADSTANTKADGTIDAPTAPTAPTFPTGGTLVGWFDKTDCNGTQWTAGTTFSDASDLYACWHYDDDILRDLCPPDYAYIINDSYEGCVYIGDPPQGPQGPQGEPGRDGVDGVNGADGAPGRDGVDGVNGADGAPGRDGGDGVYGAGGAPGRDGADGVNGADGAPGRDGADGAHGADGKDGRDGKDGKDGATGPQGIPGPPGPAGDCSGCGGMSEEEVERLFLKFMHKYNCPCNTPPSGKAMRGCGRSGKSSWR